MEPESEPVSLPACWLQPWIFPGGQPLSMLTLQGSAWPLGSGRKGSLLHFTLLSHEKGTGWATEVASRGACHLTLWPCWVHLHRKGIWRVRVLQLSTSDKLGGLKPRAFLASIPLEAPPALSILYKL